MADIQIIGAAEGNLKNISLSIPKDKLVVFTGLSGSGKSTLLLDVLFNECQRQYLEALSLQGIRKPKVERIRGASPAIYISQSFSGKNPRSTVGTMTDVYTDLRMIYEKLGLRSCPFCGDQISSAECREETEKIGSDFHVYMYCSSCGKRMDKITRTHFSFNTREGACPACEGLGRIHTVRKELVVEESLSLGDGAVRCWEKQYGNYQASILYAAFRHYGLPSPKGIPVRKFDEIQKSILYDGVESDLLKAAFPEKKPPKTTASGKFEGVLPILWRRLSEKDGDTSKWEEFFDITECPQCGGERLGPLGRSVTVNGVRLAQLAQFSLERLYHWTMELSDMLPKPHYNLAADYLADVKTKLLRFLHVGLGYLSLDRQIITLSGGELQRIRLAAVLDSELSGVLYILDEPTAGLHPKDTAGLIALLEKLRELGNSVLVIEHDADVMASADHLIDLGPGSGKYGGEVVAAGTLPMLLRQTASPTGAYLRNPPSPKTNFRRAAGAIQIRNADIYNLKGISVEIPTGCLTAVTGPSGSGKSTLVFEVLAKGRSGQENGVSGLEQFGQVVEIEQAAITKMKRSNVATYSGASAEIRAVFAQTEAAQAAGLTAKHFSFNTPGGRCENCGGLGFVESNMLFFTNIETVCPVCNGDLFSGEVLRVKYQGRSIKEVLALSVDEAIGCFEKQPKIIRILTLLLDVGLGYLELGQTLTTLSGGEEQRLKLARELIGSRPGKPNLYLMDEPTTGLHPVDTTHFLVLLDRLVDAGNTVVVVEHNQQLIRSCDWVIDLGPEGGEKGGRVIFAGTPLALAGTSHSVTAQYL